MKITVKILKDLIKEEIEKAGVNDPMKRNRTFAPPLRSEIEEEPVAGYILQELQPYLENIVADIHTLFKRVEELESTKNIANNPNDPDIDVN